LCTYDSYSYVNQEPPSISTKAAHRLATGNDALTKLLTPAEAEIMRLVWREGYTTVKQVHSVLAQHRDLAYTRTMTTMHRLSLKGVLTRRREGLAYVYLPSLSEAEFVAQRLGDILSALERDYPAAVAAYLDAKLAVA
jgi:predicted transcriptional regulator